jgi:hypothetical protein
MMQLFNAWRSSMTAVGRKRGRSSFFSLFFLEGFKPLKFPVWRLFESPHRYYEDFPKTKLEVNGKQVEVPIYEHTFTLER